MSWLYLPEQVADASPPNTCSDSEPSATSKSHPIRSRSLRPASETASSMTPPSGMTSEPSTETPGVEWWILSLRVSHANRTAEQVNGSQMPINAICGRTPFASLERSNPGMSCWRTSQDCLFTHMLAEYSQTWPRAGTIVGGIAYRLPPSAPLTSVIGSSSWPTPVGYNRGNRSASSGSRYRPSLWEMAEMGDWRKFWPTPTAGDSRGRRTSRRAKALYSAGPTLLEAIWGDRPGGKLNPDWVEWLMGWPIGWTALQPLARDRFQSWLQQHGGY